jgi:hypothetical protein
MYVSIANVLYEFDGGVLPLARKLYTIGTIRNYKRNCTV